MVSTIVRPYEMTEALTKKVTATGTDTQVWIAPYANPAAGRGRIIKCTIHNRHATNPSVVTFWDQHLTNASVPTRGATATPLFMVLVPALGATVLTEEQIPAEYYQSGIACQITNNDNYIFLEIAKDIG